MTNLTNRAKEIIEKITYITIASISKEGKPWNAPVFSAYDKDYIWQRAGKSRHGGICGERTKWKNVTRGDIFYNFYWGSYRDSQHSKNIGANKNVFLVIYDSTADAGTGEGVYIEATATELKDSKEIELAHKLLQARHHVPYWKLEQVHGNGPIRLYRAKPKKVWMNSGEKINGNYIDVRVEIDLLK